jgi:hypothetical protein
LAWAITKDARMMITTLAFIFALMALIFMEREEGFFIFDGSTPSEDRSP